MFTRSYFPADYFVSAWSVPSVPVPPWDGGFTDVGISDVRVMRDTLDLFISWKADPTLYPPGTIFQVYINYVLRSSDTSTKVTLPGVGSIGNQVVIHVGVVAPQNRDVSYADRLDTPDGSGNRARLTWYGGRWIDAQLIGFNVYQSLGPGLPVSMLAPVGSIPAAVGDVWGDGFGRGPFGRGPFGRGLVTYQWTSGYLTPGVWQFSVASLDRSGSIPATPPVVSLTIVGAPAPAPVIDGRAVWVDSFDPATGTAQLHWNT